jgi:hypothetical protein
MRRINRDLVLGFISIRKAQIIVFEVDVKVWKYQSILDVMPYDARHFVAI